MTSYNTVLEAGKAPTRKEVSRGELRDRMQQALVVRGLSPRTQEAYLAAVKGLHLPGETRALPSTPGRRGRHGDFLDFPPPTARDPRRRP